MKKLQNTDIACLQIRRREIAGQEMLSSVGRNKSKAGTMIMRKVNVLLRCNKYIEKFFHNNGEQKLQKYKIME